MPAGRPRAFDVDVALDRALEVFWRKGYEGASISDLTAAMEIARPSLYAAFGDKETLFRAALARYAAGPGSFIGRALAEPRLKNAIQRLMRDAAGELAAPGRPSGCLAVQGALVCGEAAAPIRADLLAQRQASEGAIRDRLEAGRAAGELPARYEAAALARYLASVFQGMAVQAAGGATKDQLAEVAELCLSGLQLD